MRKSNQQSLNSVKSVTKGNVEGVSLELGIQKNHWMYLSQERILEIFTFSVF